MKKVLSLLTLLIVAIGTSWGNQTELITNVTLPDVPTASLDLASQNTYEADGKGWIVITCSSIPTGSSKPTWWNVIGSGSQTPQSEFKKQGSTTTAPFVDCNTGLKINKYSPDAAIRFTGAQKASFLVSARSTTSNKEMYVALFSYDGTSQVQVGNILNTTSKDPQELIFNDLTIGTTYVAYIYGGSAGQNGSLMEIALQGVARAVNPSFSLSSVSIGTDETAQIVVDEESDLDGITLSNITYSENGLKIVDSLFCE